MLTVQASRQRGLTLIETLVAVLVGLFVVLSGIQIYVTAARGGVEATRMNRLNQDLRAALHIMMDDIRRAGHVNDPTATSGNPFTAPGTDLAVAPTCILYSYDATWNGGTGNVVDPGIDFGGFRLANEAVQFLVSPAVSSTSAACDSLAWENVTSPGDLRITALAFDLVGSKCIAFDPATYNESDPTTYVSWTTSGGTTGACTASSVGAPTPFPAAGNAFIEVRSVRISLTAQHSADASLTRSMSDTVTLRNHRVVAP